MSKKKWMRGQRLLTIPDVMAERLVYLGYIPNPRHIEFVKSLSYRSIEGYLKYPGIYKAVPNDGSGDRPIVNLKGQTSLFTEGDNE